MVRVGMGLIKNEHGVYHMRRKVPKALEEATATVMGVSRTRVSWLKETLGGFCVWPQKRPRRERRAEAVRVGTPGWGAPRGKVGQPKVLALRWELGGP